MVHVLAAITLLLSAMDHWTTYLCLADEVPGWTVAEANPLPAWLFDSLGLGVGLWIDSLVTLAALAFLLLTRRLPEPVKIVFLSLLVLATGLAVANNLQALSDLGLSPLGRA